MAKKKKPYGPDDYHVPSGGVAGIDEVSEDDLIQCLEGDRCELTRYPSEEEVMALGLFPPVAPSPAHDPETELPPGCEWLPEDDPAYAELAELVRRRPGTKPARLFRDSGGGIHACS